MVLRNVLPLRVLAAVSGGQTPLALMWKCWACGAPASRPLCLTITWALLPSRCTLAVPDPVTLLTLNGFSVACSVIA
ncbi:hypothetical protein SBADM41S_04400 [Streptomyces badius]